jgi:hypothetical protein
MPFGKPDPPKPSDSPQPESEVKSAAEDRAQRPANGPPEQKESQYERRIDKKSAPPLTRRQGIERTIATLYQPGDGVELRILNAGKYGTISGYYDDFDKLARDLEKLDDEAAKEGWEGIYLTLNPVHPDLLARARNHTKRRVKHTASDKDILCYRWLPLDFDAVRVSGISSTEREHERALTVTRQARLERLAEGWPEPVLADSGNGGWLLYRIDLPTDDESRKLVHRVIEILMSRYSEKKVTLDAKVANPSRLIKAFGTSARKGDHFVGGELAQAGERPHRRSRILEAPEHIVPVTREQLEELVRSEPEPKREAPRSAKTHSARPNGSTGEGSYWARSGFDGYDFIARYFPDAIGPESWNGGQRWKLPACEFDPEHKGSAVILRHASGAWQYKCLHETCHGHNITWRDLREYMAPGSTQAPYERRASSGSSGDWRGDSAGEWQKPAPLGSELPPVEPFRAALLPEVFRATVEDLSERMQVPLDLPAAAAMLCLAGAVNRRARIQPKRRDSTWVVVPNLWGGLVAPPGFLKSPVLAAITWPLREIEALWRATHTAEMEEYETEKEAAEARLSVYRDQLRKALKDAKAPPLRPDVSLVPPVMPRLIVGDATFEKLHELMAENPAGLLVVRDELTGWWAQLDRVGREGERAFCLQAWNGDTGHTIDRIGRGSIYVPACCLSMLGAITPGRLRSYLVDALEDGPTNDGLIQRFQLLVWPDTPPDWEYIDRLPKDDRLPGVFRRLTSLDADEPALYKFDDEAQEFFEGWLARLETRIRRDDLHPALISHLGKMRKTMPALAGLLSLADGQESPIDFAHAQMAADWCQYLESHARRVYACVVNPRMKAAADLAAKLKKGEACAGGTLTRRDVYRHQWTGLDTPERVGDALEVLRDAGWVRPCPSESNSFAGRPADRWEVNPKIGAKTKGTGSTPSEQG